MENPHQQSIRHQFHRDLQKVKYSALNKQKLINFYDLKLRDWFQHQEKKEG